MNKEEEMENEASRIVDAEEQSWLKASYHTPKFKKFIEQEFPNEDPWELMKSFFLIMFQMIPVPLEHEDEGWWDVAHVMTGNMFECRRRLKKWKKQKETK